MNPLSIEGKVVSKKSTPLVNNVPSNIEGTRFADIQNPYVNNPRQQTGWDRFLNWLGFRSGYDKSQEQYQLASDEYNAQLSQLASEEAYNSPLQQAQRMRQAGLNPDLTGLSGEPASEFDNQQESPDVGIGTDVNPLDVVKDVGQGVLSAISGTVALLNDFNLLKQAKIATDEKDIDFANKMMSFFKDHYGFLESNKGNVAFNLNESDPTIFHSSKLAKRYNKFRLKAEDSLLGLTTQYKTYDDFAKSAESLGSSMSQPWFTGFGSLTAQDVADFLRPISKAQMDLMIAQIRADNAQAWKSEQQGNYEGDTYALLNDPNQNGNTSDSVAFKNASAVSSDLDTRIAENSARQSIAPLTVQKNQIIKKMYDAISKIPDRNIGTTILKFFLMNQLSGQGVGLRDVASVAKLAL